MRRRPPRHALGDPIKRRFIIDGGSGYDLIVEAISVSRLRPEM
jgi:hypothetical protein